MLALQSWKRGSHRRRPTTACRGRAASGAPLKRSVRPPHSGPRIVNCYFCFLGTEAHGQCRNDGRFVCREHSVMHEGVLVCCECAYGQDGMLKKAIDYFSRESVGACACCAKKLTPSNWDWYRMALWSSLDEDGKRKLAELFSRPVACPKGCMTCTQHAPEDCTGWTWSRLLTSGKRCRVCGKKFYPNES